MDSSWVFWKSNTFCNSATTGLRQTDSVLGTRKARALRVCIIGNMQGLSSSAHLPYCTKKLKDRKVEYRFEIRNVIMFTVR